METSARVLNLLVRVTAGAAFVLGLAFWLGFGRSLTGVHIALGIGLVVLLWILAGIAWRRTDRAGLALFAAAWGIVTWAFGITHGRILPGSIHWIVELAHLGTAIIAVAVGARLAATLGAHQDRKTIST